MAIGSAPEIGTQFGLLKDMTTHDLEQWWEYMRREWSGNLLNGYATIITHAEMKQRQRRRARGWQ